MEANNSNYIKDVEQYFLKITRKGLMLSGKDYNLINKWFEQSVPKETLLKAIQNAVSDKDLNKLRGIYSLEDNIENFIKSTYTKVDIHKDNPSNLSKTNTLAPILRRIDSVINSKTDDNIKNALTNARYKIEELKSSQTDNFYSKLKKIESDFFDTIYDELDHKLKKTIGKDAEKKLPKEAKNFDKETKKKSVKAFRNEIVKSKLNLNEIFDLK